MCSAEYTQSWRQRNPIRASYLNLKNNAKRRGKEFTLTFAEFQQFAVKNQIVYGKKRTADTWSIDRVNPELGYSVDNIQRLTLSQNTAKRWVDIRAFEYFEDYTKARVKPVNKPIYTNSPF